MRIVLFISLLLLSYASVFSQNKADYQWIFSRDQDTLPGVQSYMFDFNEEPFRVKNRYAGLEFNGINASICDEQGNLLLYTNGCAIANGDHEVMPNGYDINEGNYFENWWGGDCGDGYPGRQDVIILPSPSNQNEYYVIHKPRTFLPSSDPINFIDEIRYTKVDLTLDNGKGDVVEKNVTFFDGTRLLWSYFDAVLHENQKDWWIIQPGFGGNSYYTFLLDSTGINLHSVQDIGPTLDHPFVTASGTAKFDPTGNYYSIFSAYTGLLLFDFDRATGALSNSVVLEVESNPDISTIFSSIEWSASGRYIYLAVHDRLYQIDSYEEDLEDGIVLIDFWNGVLDPFATTFNMMARGPDCKIYICSNSSVLSYSVIKNPDEQGTDCNLVQQGIKLPYFSTVSSMPNFPNFRIDEDEVCDSSITSIFGHPIEVTQKLKLYPNPSSGMINIELPEQAKSGNWEIRDNNSQLVKSGISSDSFNLQIDCSMLLPGVYYLKVLNKENQKYYNSRFVRM